MDLYVYFFKLDPFNVAFHLELPICKNNVIVTQIEFIFGFIILHDLHVFNMTCLFFQFYI
jgi:hypothetical protein